MNISDTLIGKKVVSLISENGLYLMLEDDGNIAIFSPYILCGMTNERDLIGKKFVSYNYDGPYYVFNFSDEITLKVDNSPDSLTGPEVLSLRKGLFTEVFYPP